MSTKAQATSEAQQETAETSDFRVQAPSEILSLLRTLQTQKTRVSLSTPNGASLSCSLIDIDTERASLSFDIAPANEQLQALLSADEITAVAYLDQIRLQFELEDPVLINAALRCNSPIVMYRFQRRQTFRVQNSLRTPQVRLVHPLHPDLHLSLRILDLSLGGVALLLPAEVEPFPPGCELASAQVNLARDIRFNTGLRLKNARPIDALGNTQLGWTFTQLDAEATLFLQRYIDQTQILSRMLRNKPAA
ncbi:flagellar brake protein [Roseateles oligotrophus]|uniref:Flagellar brake protein n=1 Tax=Roseateles oligotrophus TaxID=1769250 RepID=A0ABT2YAV3_9BURK|nr:flagellar brake protein [Roseateles oligotrophus]MCV2367413.1 flagellar brake protein [Roseateles oligotrophus]